MNIGSETNYSLPYGWKRDIVKNVITKIPATGKKLKQSEYEKKGIPVIDQGQEFIGGFSSKGELKIEVDKPVVIFGDHTKAIKYVNFDFIVGADGVKVLLPSDEFNSKLFYYFLHVVKIPDKGYARHFQYLEKANMNIPPRDQQDLIVHKLDELFSKLDAGLASLQQTKLLLNQYRQAVLKAAMEGELTKEWREKHIHELEPASALLERILLERKQKWEEEQLAKFQAQGKIPKDESWKKKYKNPEILTSKQNPELIGNWLQGEMGDLVYFKGRIGWRGLKADEYIDEGPLLLSVYNLNTEKYVDFSTVNHLTEERYNESPEIMLEEQDILLVKDGAGIGKIGIVKNLPDKATVNSSLLVIRSPKFFIPDFLFYLLKGPKMQIIVKERITGSATPHLFQRDIKMFDLVIPSLNEQEIILKKIERRISISNHNLNEIERQSKNTHKLKQSILKSAFEGKLIQDNLSINITLNKLKTEGEKTKILKSKQTTLNGWKENE